MKHPERNPEMRQRVGRRAFTLVEVTLAIGIVAFAVIAVTGVLPVALTTMRDSMDRVTEANLAKEFAGEALRSPFSQLDEWAGGGPYYFDEQGRPSEEEDAHFAVSIVLRDPSFPMGASVGDRIPAIAGSARIVELHFQRRPQAGNERDLHVYALHVANAGF